MSHLSSRMLAVGVATIAWSLALPWAASAQTSSIAAPRDIHRLGGSTAFYRPPLKTAAGLKRMGSDPRVATDIRTVLGQAGIASLTDRVVAALSEANESVRGGLCSDAAPAEGTVVECTVQPGQTMLWMAYRPTGGATLDLLRDIRWAGRSAFPAFLFRIAVDSRTYTFVLPKICGNLTLMTMSEVARLAVAAPPPAPAPTPPPAPAPPPPEASAPPPSSPAPPPAPQPTPPAVVKASPFFMDLVAGKDRRVRPIGDGTTTDGSPISANAGSSSDEFAQCSPLLGIKFGVAKRFENNWELAGAAGLAFSLVGADDKVREHAVLVDVEANKYLASGAFLGTGLSLWDITHTDSFTPGWLGHVGLPLGTHPRHPLYLLIEGRLFLDQLDDVPNNYQFWAGVRVHL